MVRLTVNFLPFAVCSCISIILQSHSVHSFTASPSVAKPLDIRSRNAESASKPLIATAIPVLKNQGGSSTSTQQNAWPLTASDPQGTSPDYKLAMQRVGITIASCYYTWYAQKQYTNVLASSAFSVLCTMVFDKRLGNALFCGTFAGMCSKAVIPSWNLALTLGVVTSILYEYMIHYRNKFAGLGGRLGLTAFLATSIVALASGTGTGVVFAVDAVSWKALKKSTILPMALWHAVGAVATIILREKSDDQRSADPVRASAVVGLTGALLLQDKAAALAVYGGSFVGMAAPARLMYGLPRKKGKGNANANVNATATPGPIQVWTAFALAAALGGVVHGATIDWGFWPGGWGGKAGTCAFVGCVLYRTLATIVFALLGK